jgi:hypothetical protein
VPLRLREDRFVGTTFPCPECRVALVLMLGENESRVVQRATVLEPGRAVAESGATRPGSQRWQLPTLSPLVVAWGLAGVVAAVLIGAAVRDHYAAITPRHSVAINPPVANEAPAEIASPQEDTPSTTVAEVVAPVEQPDNHRVLPEAPLPSVAAHNPPEPPVSAQAAVPIAPVVAPKPDAGVLLGQRLVSFQQAKPVARRALLQTVEDLLDRPVRVADDVPAEVVARLDAAVAVTLQNVTVEELLREILSGTGLEFVCTPDAVQLRGMKP